MSANVHGRSPGDIRGFVADISGMSGKVVNEFGPNRYGTCALPIPHGYHERQADDYPPVSIRGEDDVIKSKRS